MLKEIFATLKAGLVFVLCYVVYAIVIFILTVLLGTPIYFGVQYIHNVVAVLI